VSDALRRALLLNREKRYDDALRFAAQAVNDLPNTPGAWMLLATLQLRLKRIEGVGDALSTACRLEGDRPELVLRAAKLLRGTGDFEGALSLIDRGLRWGEDRNLLDLQFELRKRIGWIFGWVSTMERLAQAWPSESYYRRLAGIYLGLDDHERAIEAYEKALLLAPSDAEAALRLVEVHCRERRWEDARAVLRRLPASPDVAAWLIEAGALNDAWDMLREVAPDSPRLAQVSLWHGETVDGAPPLVRGITAVRDGEHEVARKAFLDVREPSESLEAGVWIAEMHRREGNVDACKAELGKVVHRARGYYLAAQFVRLRANLSADAQGALDPDVYADLLSALLPVLPDRVEDIERCLAQGYAAPVRELLNEAAQRIEPNYSLWPTARLPNGLVVRIPVRQGARHASRSAQMLIRTRTPEEVLQRFPALLDAHPRAPTVWCHQGEVLLWLGRYQEAEAAFARACEMRGNTKWAWIGRGASVLLRGDPAAAIRVWDDSLKVLSEAGRTMYVYRAEAHRRLGNLDASRADIETCLSINPQRLAGWINDALLLHEAGDNEAFCARYAETLAYASPLFRNIAVDLGWAGQPTSRAQQVQLLEQSLKAMRGNRASTVVTYWVGDTLRFWEVPSRA
jgi:tetratricopeptide (TPR) repeat protein